MNKSVVSTLFSICIAVIVGLVASWVVSLFFTAIGMTPEKGIGEWLIIIGSGIASGVGLFLWMQSKLFKG